MPRTPVTTTLYDAEGEPHEYETIPWGFDKAIELKLELAALLGEPLGSALAALLGGGGLDLDAEIDAGEIGRAIGQLPRAIIERGGPALIARILHDTIRRGKGPDGRPVALRLRDAVARDEAYGGGNLWEAYEAVAWVLKVNYGPFWTALWGRLRGLWPMLRERLPETTTTETVQASAS